jgi:hypothetical protein
MAGTWAALRGRKKARVDFFFPTRNMIKVVSFVSDLA